MTNLNIVFRKTSESSASPVVVALAAAIQAGKVWDERSRTSFAERVADALNGQCAEVSGWQQAVASLGNLDQTPAIRKVASRIVREHWEVLEYVAARSGEVARLCGLKSSASDPMWSADWEFQNGVDSSLSLGEAVSDSRFLDAGRFSALPDGIELPTEIYVAPNRPGKPQAISIEQPETPLLEDLSKAMTDQWGFLYERAAKEANQGVLNVNTLTRYAYNTYGLRQILRRLEERDVRSARVLLVTAYESPLQELLESNRVSEVVAIDLSRSVCKVVSDKYAQHPQAQKIRLKILDYSGLEPQFQVGEINELLASRGSTERPLPDAILRHFSRIASRKHFVGLELESESFDAVHLPFVMGSLYLSPMTVVIDHCQVALSKSGRDYTDFLGSETLRTSEAQQAALAVMGHALKETRRITKSGGLSVVNMWGRPQPDAAHLIRLSDTPISRGAFDQLMQGFRRLFSGNPQPTLPHTVGHIFIGQKKLDTP